MKIIDGIRYYTPRDYRQSEIDWEEVLDCAGFVLFVVAIIAILKVI